MKEVWEWNGAPCYIMWSFQKGRGFEWCPLVWTVQLGPVLRLDLCHFSSLTDTCLLIDTWCTGLQTVVPLVQCFLQQNRAGFSFLPLFSPFQLFWCCLKKKTSEPVIQLLLSGFQISFYQAIHTNITKYVSDKWFWSVKKSLGLLLKLKGFAYVVWASALGSKGSRFMSAQRPIHFPTSSTPRKGLHS